MIDYSQNLRRRFADEIIKQMKINEKIIGISVGLALEGKIPIAFSITPFLLYRPFETIRNYLQNEKIPVKLIGSGRDKDYSHDGFSHWAEEDRKIMDILNNIKGFWPDTADEVSQLVPKMLTDPNPWYINLKR